MLPKAYDPKGVEDRIYRMWEESGAFRADVTSKKVPFAISMPPPNATGQLHLGHACGMTIEDIFIRFQRMRGKEVLWLPGTDHASIATENVVIREITEKEGITDPRTTLGREELLKRIHSYVEGSRSRIRSQVRRMGASCDWSRERYTMDPMLARTTFEVFKDMVESGVIYRGHRIVNWDPKLQTTLSDDEVEREEERAPFYTFQYGPFQIGTARPETKFGDKFVVMHPKDLRYQKYKHGDTFTCEWINGPVTATIIKDEAVDPEFGTGVMTITPWHDRVDFEIAARHKLEKIQIIDFQGKLLPIAGEFAGIPIEEARPNIVEKLRKKGLLVKTDENYVHNVAISSRGGGLVEPQVKEQWFVDVNRRAIPWKGEQRSIKEVLQDVVRSGMIRIIPERFAKIYFHWIDELRDWCVSRQIWWGHRIPVWYCVGDDHCKIRCHEPIVAISSPQACPHCGSRNLAQDPDTLDTWYGVSQWTWSTLIDPKLIENPSLSLQNLLQRSPDFQRFHPTDVMETGYDILFFWVARMILMTTYTFSRLGIGTSESDRLPFRAVYLHGLVRTREGKKMSKSDPETCIDPLEMISAYGADALRLSMIVGQSPGNDFRLYQEKIAGYRNFVNKLWNAARFVLMACEKEGIDPKRPALSLADRWILSMTQKLIVDVTEGLEHYRLSQVGEMLYDFVWSKYCDWYVELSKEQPNVTVLLEVLRTLLKLLHPYTPFVTEEIWAKVGEGMLMQQVWPEADSSLQDQEAEDHITVLMDLVSAVRTLRSDQKIAPSKKVDLLIHTQQHLELLRILRPQVMRLAGVRDWTLDAVPTKHHGAASVFLKDIEVHVPLVGLLNLEKLQKERDTCVRYRETLERALQDGQFIKKAPANIIEGKRAKLQELKERLRNLEERLASLAD